MSYFDIQSSSDRNIVCQFLIEKLSLGHFLRYTDYEIIDRWLFESKNVEQLLLVIEEVLNSGSAKQNFSVKSLEKKILRRLQNQT